MEYRESIRERMSELGWNQAGLAVASAVNPATLSRFFSGKQELDVPQLAAIARAMGLQPGDLLDRSETDPMADRLNPVIARLRPLRIEDQIRAVAALAQNLDFMLGWRGERVDDHQTLMPSKAYNPRPTNSVNPRKTDSEEAEEFGAGAATVQEPNATARAAAGRKEGGSGKETKRR